MAHREERGFWAAPKIAIAYYRLASVRVIAILICGDAEFQFPAAFFAVMLFRYVYLGKGFFDFFGHIFQILDVV
jgi:hypothetical protein